MNSRDRYGWLDQAACRAWPDWDTTADHHALLRVCAGCPVRQPCLDSALELRTGGVRGGTLPAQRKIRKWAGTDMGAWVAMRDGRPRHPAGEPLAGLERWWRDHGGDGDRVVPIGPRIPDMRPPPARPGRTEVSPDTTAAGSRPPSAQAPAGSH